jgi:hypothetical protein
MHGESIQPVKKQNFFLTVTTIYRVTTQEDKTVNLTVYRDISRDSKFWTAITHSILTIFSNFFFLADVFLHDKSS